MSFDMNPADEDPHGECRHEIKRLQALIVEYHEAKTEDENMSEQCGDLMEDVGEVPPDVLAEMNRRTERWIKAARALRIEGATLRKVRG